MPELPEVETVRQTLKRQILNKKINKVEVYYEKMLENTNVLEFKTLLVGQTFKDILRYGKYLFFILDDYIIISHLRMEGKFFLKGINDIISNHEHIIFTLDDNISFRYHDTRRFGKMILLKTSNYKDALNYPAIKKLGKEANDETFTKEELYALLKNKKMPIKTALLNQEIIAGLGNIYVDEVCFLSKLHPKTSASCLSINDAQNILDASKVTLAKAIKAGGTTIRSYTSSLGVTGLFQLELLVHSKEKEPCPICQTPIKKIFVGGRGTYYCPNCQIKEGTYVIGITGSIATGKTTVTNYLSSLGYDIIDADVIVKEEKLIKGKMYNELVKAFGNAILDEDGNISDKLLATLIFNNPTIKERVNNIIHPIVYDITKKAIQKSKKRIIFLSVPLLFESGFDEFCDEIICIYTNHNKQIERLMNRNNISYEDALKRIEAQMSLIKKCQKSDFIIDNSNDLCYTIKQTDEILNKLKNKLGG